MNRVVVLGRGAAGKSVFARTLSRATDIPCVELDKVFWSASLEPTTPDAWRRAQEELIRSERWILDGDLGPYDDVGPRLRAADTVVIFDGPVIVCAWRAIRRSRERMDFWRWLFAWRRRYRPALLSAIQRDAPNAAVFVVRNGRDRERVLAELVRRSQGDVPI